ncbi:aminotransferase class V-fold PLP-dependent enzyme [Saccharothrix longispora]|uniref:aminotransferase class V-fold PLP-dependent enzyme n=1 Tax=Saccharothrix longispora TaxID=33920 RepID=UPI0028FD6D63|nr:aminotransferase class V-fold PLP-dependent enzyme [Saccharothrix longispora]MDU0293367.1 aminotransferase class V-fold PLP-dependent enzyme [Saccharothrix longispora]
MREAFGTTFDVPLGYLNTAAVGVPPAPTAAAVADAVRRWSTGLDNGGTADPHVTAARRAFGRLVGVPGDRVASGASVSQLVALVAASVPPTTSVLVAKGDFTSLTFPFAAHDLRITEVDLDDVPAHAPRHDLVAVSVVQSADGRAADLDALRAAGTPVLLDATQAVGWTPLDLGWADWVVAAGYKFLMAPRGCAWLACSPAALARTTPAAANWYAGDDPWTSVYGLPLRLAPDARRLDLSPVWLSQFGAAESLPYLAGLDLGEVREHAVGLANDLLTALDLPPTPSPIVSLGLPGAAEKLAAAGVRSSVRAGRVRLAFHLYNTAEDVDAVLAALR